MVRVTLGALALASYVFLGGQKAPGRDTNQIETVPQDGANNGEPAGAITKPPPAPPRYEPAADITIVGQIIAAAGTTTTAAPGGAVFNLRATATIAAGTVTITVATGLPPADYPAPQRTPQPIETVATASLADLNSVTTVQPGPQGVLLKLECNGGGCFTIQPMMGDSPIGQTNHHDSFEIPLSLDASTNRLLELRRALARIIDPGHVDQDLCTSVARVGGAPQCDATQRNEP